MQTRYGRDPDGIVREQEMADLNVPAVYRLRQIDSTWSAGAGARTSAPLLMVHIPEYALHIYERGHPVLDMRVVVGKALTATPVFSDL